MVQEPTEPSKTRRHVSEGHERARALAAVLREQAERADAALVSHTRGHRRLRRSRSVLAIIWLAVAYVWLATPSWLTVEAPAPQTLAEEARALRLNVYLQSQAIKAYRLDRGRLPAVLQQAGPPFRGMTYRRLDNRSYELMGRSARIELHYDSDLAALDFVGSAAHLLTGAPDRVSPDNPVALDSQGKDGTRSVVRTSAGDR